MTRIPGWIKSVSLVAGLAITSTASATLGYFGLGYGAKAMGVAGAVVANPQDSATIAVNPAGITAVGERVDIGARMFSPQRKAELETSAIGANFDVKDDSRRNLFLIPNFGFNIQLGENLWFGFNNYGNGGMNSTYDRNLYDEASAVVGAFGQGFAAALAAGATPEQAQAAGEAAAGMVPKGTTTSDVLLDPVTGKPLINDVGTLGVDLAQGIFAPTLAMKFRNKHSIGVSLLIGVQRFSARGLGNFQCFTKSAATNPANAATCPQGFAVKTSNGLTNNDSGWSYGAGARIGWMGEMNSRLTLGASASSKVYMSEFDDYDELFAEDGDFDIPANVTLGVTFKATPDLKLSFDFQRIFYEGVNSISNEGPVVSPLGVGPAPPCANDCWLGMKDGMGFGWEDINVYRVAAEYAYGAQWIFRTGFSYNQQPIPKDQVLFNFLAPASIQKHATVGFTFSPDKNSEWNLAYMHAFREKVQSNKTAFGIPGSLEMYQNSVDVSYSYKF